MGPQGRSSVSNNTGETQRPQQSQSPYNMKYLIRALVKYGASDLHMKVGRPPLFRINGKLIPAKMSEFSQQTISSILFPLMSEKQLGKLDSERQVDLSFQMEEFGRFRCNIFYQR